MPGNMALSRIVAAVMLGLALPAAAQDPPGDPAESICRPRFLVDGKPLTAGTAFALAPRAQGGDPLLVTAIHLLGPAGGLAQDVPWDRMALRVRLAHCDPIKKDDPEAGEGWRGGPALGVPGARPMGALPYRDIAAFPLGTSVPLLELASVPPRPGDKVWLVAEVLNAPGKLLHRATVNYSGVQALQYVFDDPALQLRATSGAPVIDAAGQVVGINLGGGKDGADLIGIATSLQVLTVALRDAS